MNKERKSERNRKKNERKRERYWKIPRERNRKTWPWIQMTLILSLPFLFFLLLLLPFLFSHSPKSKWFPVFICSLIRRYRSICNWWVKSWCFLMNDWWFDKWRINEWLWWMGSTLKGKRWQRNENLNNWVIVWSIGRLIYCLIVRLIGCSIGWLIHLKNMDERSNKWLNELTNEWMNQHMIDMNE